MLPDKQTSTSYRKNKFFLNMMRSADIILVVSFSSLMTFGDLLPNVELGGTSWDGHENLL